MSYTINANMVKNLSVDIDTADAIDAAGKATGGRLKSRENDSVLDNVLLGLLAESRIAMLACSGNDVAETFGVAAGTVSKSRKFARVAHYASSERGDGSPYDADMEAKLGRLMVWWTAEHEGKRIGSLRSHLDDYVAPSGENRPSAIVALVNTFGASNRIDDIMEGRRVHHTMEADDDGDVDGDDDEATSGLDMIAQAISVAKAQGYTVDQIAEHCMALLGG